MGDSVTLVASVYGDKSKSLWMNTCHVVRPSWKQYVVSFDS